MGQVSGVALGANGTLWVLHRGPRAWGEKTFNGERITERDPISGPMVLQLDQDTGKVGGGVVVVVVGRVCVGGGEGGGGGGVSFWGLV